MPPRAMKSVVADPGRYDWEGDVPLQRPFAETVIYELHVRGFTRHPSSGVAAQKRGTYAGLIEKIPVPPRPGRHGRRAAARVSVRSARCARRARELLGLPAVSFFAPHHAYSSRPSPLAVLDEFRDMVKALHRAGIEVILDVVFNHTTEGGSRRTDALLSRPGQRRLLHPRSTDKSRYDDYTGCGNTLNANQPIVRRLIQDSLRYWVTEMHVDGFRFDLASILSRDEDGHPLPNPPVLWDIESDPLLAGTKLIAEAWDAAGLYQVGSFIGDAWQEWNGRFRDDVRRFVKGDDGTVSRLATRLLGSPDLYGHEEREAEQSINFVTCHDGFTLNDLVSYNRKHNEANGENNRDGSNDNLSWNCGTEGPTDDPGIEALRNRQVKNLFGAGAAGGGHADAAHGRRGAADAARQQQRLLPGQRDQLVRLEPAERHADIHRFVRELNAVPSAPRCRGRRASAQPEPAAAAGAHRVARRRLNQPDWSDAFAFAGVHAAEPERRASCFTSCSMPTGNR